MKGVHESMRSMVPPSAERLIKRVVSTRYYRIFNPNWHRRAVGGMWDEIGKLQFNFLVEQGLKPGHFLLDVGCGSLRGGIHFIRYLEPEHYFGIDISKVLLAAGRFELRRYNLTHKNPILVQMDDFNFRSIHQEFHLALAHSLFTHLPLNSMIRCLLNIEKVLTSSGRFYATFFENPKGKFNLEPVVHPRADGPDFETYFDKDPYHYDVSTFEQICEGIDLRVEYIGNWNHPRDQRWLVFIKK